MRSAAVLIALIAIALVQALPLFAGVHLRCAMLADLSEQLKSNFGEERVGAGLSTQLPNGRQAQVLYQLFQSNAGTWTLVIVTPDGYACPLAAGTHWETYPIPKTGTEG
jgi:hypothetical protein